MVICGVCQGTQFSCESGLYYCVECHTQVQGWQDEEVDLDVLSQARLKRSSQLQNLTGETTSDTGSDSRTWTTWEAYNYVLLGQVQELEELSVVNTSFRFTVLSLWTKYLHCKGYAFLQDSQVPDRALATSRRDQAALTKTKLSLWKIKKKTERQRRIERAQKASIGGQDDTRSEITQASSMSNLKTALASKVYNESVVSVPNKSEDWWEALSQVNSSRLSSTCSHQSSGVDVTSEKHYLKLNDQNLNRETLIAILFLAMRLSRSDYCLSDMLRWVQQGHLSCRHIAHLLPDHMRVIQEDFARFGAFAVPTPQMFLDRMCKLSELLELTTVPLPDIALLVGRYVKDFNLPEVLCQQAANFIAKFAIPKNPWPERSALAILIVLLKLQFGLDDVTEHQLSIHADNCSPDLFNWDQWVRFIEMRSAVLVDNWNWAKLVFDREAPYQKFNVTAAKGVEQDPLPFNDNAFRIAGEIRKNVTDQVNFFSKSSSGNFEFLDPNKFPATLYPLSDGLKIVFDHLKTKSPVFEIPEFLQQDFSQSIFTCAHENDEHVPVRPVKYLFAQDYIVKQSNLKVRVQRGEKVWHSYEGPLYDSFLPSRGIKTDPSSNFWHLPLDKDAYHQNGLRKFYYLSFLPSSFLWLLDFCSKVLNCKHHELQKVISDVEKALIQNQS